MKSTNRLIGAALAALTLVGAPCIFAQDWPQWRGPDRNDKVTGFTAPQTWPKELTLKWKATVGPGRFNARPWWATSFTSSRGRATMRSTTCLDAADRQASCGRTSTRRKR